MPTLIELLSSLEHAVQTKADSEVNLTKQLAPLKAAVKVITSKKVAPGNLTKLATSFYSNQALVIYNTFPSQSLSLLIAVISHAVDEELNDLSFENGKKRFDTANTKLGEAWETVVEGTLRGLKRFCQNTGQDATSVKLKLEHKNLLGEQCFKSLTKILLHQNIHPMIKRRVLDVFEYATKSTPKNKMRLAKVDYLGPNVLANLIASCADQGVTERALELAFRIGVEIARDPSSNSGKVNKAKWESNIFPAKLYGGSQSVKKYLEKLRGMSLESFMDDSPDLLDMMSERKADGFRTFPATQFTVNASQFEEVFALSFNKASFSAITNVDNGDDTIEHLVEFVYSDVKNVDIKRREGTQTFLIYISLSHPPTSDFFPVKALKNKSHAVTFSVDEAAVPKLKRVLDMHKLKVTAKEEEPSASLPTPGETPHAKAKSKAVAAKDTLSDKSPAPKAALPRKSPTSAQTVSTDASESPRVKPPPFKLSTVTTPLKAKKKEAVVPWMVKSVAEVEGEVEVDQKEDKFGKNTTTSKNRKSSVSRHEVDVSQKAKEVSFDVNDDAEEDQEESEEAEEEHREEPEEKEEDGDVEAHIESRELVPAISEGVGAEAPEDEDDASEKESEENVNLLEKFTMGGDYEMTDVTGAEAKVVREEPPADAVLDQSDHSDDDASEPGLLEQFKHEWKNLPKEERLKALSQLSSGSTEEEEEAGQSEKDETAKQEKVVVEVAVARAGGKDQAAKVKKVKAKVPVEMDVDDPEPATSPKQPRPAKQQDGVRFKLTKSQKQKRRKRTPDVSSKNAQPPAKKPKPSPSHAKADRPPRKAVSSDLDPETEIRDLLVSLSTVIAVQHTERMDAATKSFLQSQLALENRGRHIASKFFRETNAIVDAAEVAFDLTPLQENVLKATTEWADSAKEIFGRLSKIA